MPAGVQVVMETSPRSGRPTRPAGWFFSSESPEEHERNKWNRSPPRSPPRSQARPFSPRKPTLCGVLWDKGGAMAVADSDEAEIQPLRGNGCPSFYRAVVDKKLVLRTASDLNSKRVGDVVSGTFVTVLEEIAMANNDIRARIGRDTSPRGLGGFDLGWVTAVKDGDSYLVPLNVVSSNSNAAYWSRLRRYDGNESTASRIAKRRTQRQQSKMARSRALLPGSANPEAAPETAPESKKKKKKEEPVRSSLELNEIVERLVKEAEAFDTVQYDTTSSILGQLLHEKGIKVDTMTPISLDSRRTPLSHLMPVSHLCHVP